MGAAAHAQHFTHDEGRVVEIGDGVAEDDRIERPVGIIPQPSCRSPWRTDTPRAHASQHALFGELHGRARDAARVRQ